MNRKEALKVARKYFAGAVLVMSDDPEVCDDSIELKRGGFYLQLDCSGVYPSAHWNLHHNGGDTFTDICDGEGLRQLELALSKLRKELDTAMGKAWELAEGRKGAARHGKA